MKFRSVVALLFVFCLTEVFSQGKKISITQNETDVRQVLLEIEKQTSYTVAYNETDFNVYAKTQLPASNYELDKLLSILLKGTGCRYMITERHILIVPQQEKPDKAYNPDKQYNGKVVSKEDSRPLPYATVTLLNSENQTMRVGITNEEGYYSIKAPGNATHTRVSYLGYQTQTMANKGAGSGVFFLEKHIVELGEVITSANARSHTVDNASYFITQQMRQGATNAFELLGKIPNVRINRMENTVKTGKDETALLLIDGVQQSEEYIKNIPSERVLKIEVIDDPSGRFVSDNYSIILNYILKKEYTGYDVHLENRMMINPAGTNGSDWLAHEQPNLNLSYDTKNINVYAHYDYKRTKLNRFHSRHIVSEKHYHIRSEDIFQEDPNDLYSNRSNHVVAGLRYAITPDHAVTFQQDYTHTMESTENNYLIALGPEQEPTPFEFLQKDTTTTRLKSKDYLASLFYNGHINDYIQLYGDFFYNRYSNDVDNLYSHDYYMRVQNIFQEKKDQLSFNAEGYFRLSPWNRFTAGYSNNWRKYTSDSSTGDQFIDYTETRNKFFFYWICNLTGSLQTRTGSSFEHIRTRSLDYTHTLWAIQPHVQVNYNANKNLNLSVSYTSNRDNPSLYQLSTMPLLVDTLINQIGNPQLKTSVNHLFSAKLSYKNRLYLKGEVKYSPDGIGEIFSEMNSRIYTTYENYERVQYTLQLDYRHPLGDRFNWKSAVVYYFNESKYQNIRDYLDGWLIDAGIEYFDPNNEFEIQLSYHKNRVKNLIWQGYQTVNYDKWEITACKYFLNKQVAVMLSYIPPIDWGIDYKQEKKVNSDLYKENSYASMKTYRNMLFLKIEFRINKGKRKPAEQAPVEYDTDDRRRLDSY